MSRPFELFAAWRPAPIRATHATTHERDEAAWQRWDGEGGNPGRPAWRGRLIRANARARLRRAARIFTFAVTDRKTHGSQ